MSATPTYRLGFDIGGTFTDFVLVEEGSGRMTLGKTLTTPHNPAEAVETGLDRLLTDAGIDGAQLGIAIHATTLITNALIQRKGARTALLATRGFRDTLEMGNELRWDNYALTVDKPTPLVPRALRFDVPERMAADGSVVETLDDAAVQAIAEDLRRLQVEAVAIVFLHSFRNPAHEERAAAILRAMLPGIPVSLSSSVSPEIREYERTSTTVANAYVQPIVASYLDTTQAKLTAQSYRRPLYIMVSSGGIAGAATVKEMPIRMLESGPTAGVLAAQFFSRALGIPDMVTFDMGGTTAKIGLIKDGQPKKSNLFEFGRTERFMKGSGLPASIPMIELLEIGAGGGSIAACDALGLLNVGPASAGSAPGPACYGRGGEHPTVTDANLLLGYLNPDYFLGGAMKLDVATARRAFETHLCPRMGGSAEDCARGVFEVVNHAMLSAARVHIAERGQDPRRLHLFAFGGAGPAHAYELARALQMKGIIVPAGAGAASALGLVASPVAFDFSRSCPQRLDRASWSAIGPVFDAMRCEGEAVLQDAGVSQADCVFSYRMDMRHLGQGREITVEIPPVLVAAGDLAGISDCFYREHQERFGHVHRHLPAELVSCRMTAQGPQIDFPLPQLAAATEPAVPKARRPVFFPEAGRFLDTPVYERAAFGAGITLQGPVMIEERECTVAVGPSARLRVDAHGSLLVELMVLEARVAA
jgi:N-methylhydantoinase A